MLKFKQFITESVRVGLPSVSTMSHEQFSTIARQGHVNIDHMTEKTDGVTHKMGWDEHGFYTQGSGSGSERMRTPEDHINRAKRRAEETGKPLDLTAANAFAHMHSVLQKNTKLQDYLREHAKKHGGETTVKGEMFYKPLSRPSEEHPGEIKFVGTSYHPGHMGSVGKYVLHSGLDENKHHDPEAFKGLGSSEINFDHDKIEHPKAKVDISDEAKEFGGLNHELIRSRTTPKNKEQKMAEIAKFEGIKQKVSNKVDNAVKGMNIKPKWGSGSEGAVIHPPKNSEQPRIKVTSDAFRKFKADTKGTDFRSRNQ